MQCKCGCGGDLPLLPVRRGRKRIYINEAHRAKWRAKQEDAKKKMMKAFIASLKTECQECSATEKLHFHHVDPTIKSFSIAAAPRIVGWGRLREELEKCIVLCESCHRKKHGKKK